MAQQVYFIDLGRWSLLQGFAHAIAFTSAVRAQVITIILTLRACLGGRILAMSIISADGLRRWKQAARDRLVRGSLIDVGQDFVVAERVRFAQVFK